MLQRALALLFIVCLPALSSTQAQAASVLPVYEPLTVAPGDLLEQVIEWNRDSELRLELRLMQAPPGASLVVNDDGQLLLRFQTGPQLADETPLIIQVRDIDTLTIIDTRVLIVRNLLTMAEAEAIDAQESEQREAMLSLALQAPELAMPASGPATQSLDSASAMHEREVPGGEPSLGAGLWADLAAALATPSLPPSITLAHLPGQIVSAGRAVSVRFGGQSSDGNRPLISFDRIPANATLDRYANGSYLFFWQTSDRDQGEHVFRVSATHPDDQSLGVTRDLVIVVGDPSRGKRLPAGSDVDGT